MRLMRCADEPARARPTSPPFESLEALCCAQCKPAYWGCRRRHPGGSPCRSPRPWSRRRARRSDRVGATRVAALPTRGGARGPPSDGKGLGLLIVNISLWRVHPRKRQRGLYL